MPFIVLCAPFMCVFIYFVYLVASFREIAVTELEICFHCISTFFVGEEGDFLPGFSV